MVVIKEASVPSFQQFKTFVFSYNHTYNYRMEQKKRSSIM